MKRIDYVIAGVLVLIGLLCLTTSGSYLIGFSIEAYMETFLQLCMWIGIPIVVIGVIYFIILFLRKG
jgi:di/tricarboxylate transporter